MILIVFPFQEDAGIKVVRAGLESITGKKKSKSKKKKLKKKSFFEELVIGKVKSEKACTEKIFSKCKKLSQLGKRIDAVVLIRSNLSSSYSLSLSYVPKSISQNLMPFIEEQQISRARSKPEISEISKTDFPIKLNPLGNFSPLTLLVNFSFNRINPFDYDLKKFRRKQFTPELQTTLKYLKNLLANLQDYSTKKRASISRQKTKAISVKLNELEQFEKEITDKRKEIELEQDKTKKEQLIADFRAEFEQKVLRAFKEFVFPVLAQKSAHSFSLMETSDGAGKNLAVKISDRTIMDVFLGGDGKPRVQLRGIIEMMELSDFYEKLCKDVLSNKWKDKLRIK